MVEYYETIQKLCLKCDRRLYLSSFHKNKRMKDGLSSWCKECNNANKRLRYKSDPKKFMDNQRSYRKSNPEKSFEIRRKTWLKRSYGMSIKEYDTMLQVQGGGCGVCGVKVDSLCEKRSLAVDHDHVTGSVRGILCSPCNMALGLMGDDISKIKQLIRYLEEST